jgi:ferrous iron transport protein A
MGWRSDHVTRLSQLAVGQDARVAHIEGTDDVSMRLLEMGLTPGVAVHVLGSAPLGDPLELQVRGYRLSVRRSEAARVVLERILPAREGGGPAPGAASGNGSDSTKNGPPNCGSVCR